MSLLLKRKQLLLRDAGLYVPARPAIIRPRERNLVPGFCIPHVVAAAVSAGITFVGSAVANVINGGTASINLTTIAGLAQNDIVLAFACGSNESSSEANPSGYTAINSTTNPLCISTLSYKIQTSSVDTSISFFDTGDTTDSGCAIAMAFRGVSTSTPLDGVTPTKSASSVNPPSITPTSNNCAIVIFGASEVIDTSIGTVTNYTQPTNHTTTSNDGQDTTIAAAYRILVGGAGVPEDPAAWSTWASGSDKHAYTVALRPA